MKRKDGESFEDYRNRRKAANIQQKNWWNERLVKIWRPKPKPRPPTRITAIPDNPASGKRHACETAAAFRARRKKCNAGRRAREKTRQQEVLDAT